MTEQLGKDWYRGTDIAVVSQGDSDGMHYFVGREAEGYAWRPLATILPAGTDASSWTGYSCVSGDDRYMLATLEPIAATNRPEMLDRGGLSYTIDLKTGKVTSVVAGVAMYYHSPGCGIGHTGVLARYLGSDQETTELLTVDISTGKVTRHDTLQGQYTSAVPLSSGRIAAYHAGAVVAVGSGSTVSQLAKVGGAAFDLAPSSDGGLDYLSTDFKASSQAWHWHGGSVTDLGSGPLKSVQLFPGADGRNVLTGITTRLAKPAAAPLNLNSSTIPVLMSRQGHVMGFADSAKPTSKRAALQTHPFPGLVSNLTGKAVDSWTPEGTAAPVTRSLPPALATPQARAGSLATSNPLCAVPRNDVHRQVLQPNAAQVEWAADEAVRGALPSRPANFASMNFAAYNPSSDIPLPGLTGGGTVPAQVLLGVFAQESNFYQASWHALPGVAANPLIADYYGGGPNNVSTINYPAADCGYGLGQITTGMHVGDTVYASDVQAKIAVDYTENAAAAAQILEQKWNQTYAANIRANNADPKYVENWYLALWAYNSGINPGPKTGNTTGCTPGPSCTDGAGNWGLGWTNNPENTSYPPNRDGFLRSSYADAATPGKWPYQEKILGWAEIPILDYQGKASYVGFGSGKVDVPLPRTAHTFCLAGQAGDNCDQSNPNHCTLTGSIAYHCWLHTAVTWATDCSQQCNSSIFSYNTGDPEPASQDPHPPDCNSSLPSNAVIVDDEPTDLNVVGCGTTNWSSQGSFALTQGTDASGAPISVIDTHQLGAGFGGHLFFTHNRAANDTAHLVTGTWKVNLPTQVYHVLAHVPSTGGTTRTAHYAVTANDGTTYDRVVDQYQQQDQWAGVGFFTLGGNAQVTLNNVTDDAVTGAHDVAFDALAFIPVPGQLVTHTIDAVSLFDPNQDLNTNLNYLMDTPVRTMTTLHDWAMQYGGGGKKWDDPSSTYQGVSMQAVCSAGTVASNCVPQDVWNVGMQWATDANDAGTTTTGHRFGMTEPTWLGFGNLQSFPPATTFDPAMFSNDLNYKVKSHLDVSFVISNGQIVSGSQDLHFRERTASTHLPDFVVNFMKAVQADYGIAPPNLTYNEVDANLFSGDATPIDPLQNDVTPGRDYVWHADSPTITDNGTCVATHTIMGGSIGWRPLAAQTPVWKSVVAWVRTLENDSRVNWAVQSMAVEIDKFFFAHPEDVNNPASVPGSLFLNASPIWQQIHAKVCANGSISSAATVDNTDETPKRTIADQSYMPNLYLYFDNKMIDNAGAPTTGQVHTGNFSNFSNMPYLNSWPSGGNAFGYCSVSDRGAGGNPWDIEPPGSGGLGSAPDIRPKTGRWCDTVQSYGNPYNN